ncbi:MAG TPA: hypothetical protein VN844_09330 [Pyrinomonadaceae bacterium]|nr:hypothetical protein [Pyrinomonadaceae bacterium]
MVMSDVDTNGFGNAFDEHIRSISRQVIEEEFAKHQTGEGFVTVDPGSDKVTALPPADNVQRIYFC